MSQGSAGEGWRPAPPSPRVVAGLRAARLLASFTDTGIQILATIAQERSVPAGTALFVEGEAGESLYVVTAGRLRISVSGASGPRSLASLGETESLGEAALLRAGTRMCTAVAEVPTTVLELRRRDVSSLQRVKPQACLKLIMNVADVLAERLRASDSDLKDFLEWKLGAGQP
jgi:CRP/FNR family cyclic AMP-dependent transcriptional regulator